MTRCTVSTVSATAGASHTCIAFCGTPDSPKLSKSSVISHSASSGMATKNRAPTITRSSVVSSRISGNPASRNASGATHRSPIQIPKVSPIEPPPWRNNCEANHTIPMVTISAPTGFSGRLIHAAMPLAVNDQPTNRASSVSVP